MNGRPDLQAPTSGTRAVIPRVAVCGHDGDCPYNAIGTGRHSWISSIFCQGGAVASPGNHRGDPNLRSALRGRRGDGISPPVGSPLTHIEPERPNLEPPPYPCPDLARNTVRRISRQSLVLFPQTERPVGRARKHAAEGCPQRSSVSWLRGTGGWRPG